MAVRDTIAEALLGAANNAGLMPELHALLAKSSFIVPVSRVYPTSDSVPVTAILLWKDPSDGVAFVPLFTNPARVPPHIPPAVALMWDSLERLTNVLSRAHFRINPAGPVMYDLPSPLAHSIVGNGSAPGIRPTMFPAGSEMQIGQPTEDLQPLIAALRSYFARQSGSPPVFLYEVHRNDSPTPALAIGVVSDFDGATASALGAIVPEAYQGNLPAEITFIGAHPEIGVALVRLGIAPILIARAPKAPN